MRKLIGAVAVVLAVAATAEAKRVMIAYNPVQKLVRADAVVIGKVTALEKELTQATPFPDAKDKIGYKVAVIKVET
ncbi:MAG: hypothetical protein K2V38_16970, partial [Gemmataceae bacterium]|nr:hypothetical protein [Gemmataceae bacterium]